MVIIATSFILLLSVSLGPLCRGAWFRTSHCMDREMEVQWGKWLVHLSICEGFRYWSKAQGDLAAEWCLNKTIALWGNNHMNHETYLKWGKMIPWIGVSEASSVIIVKLLTLPCSRVQIGPSVMKGSSTLP